MININNFLSLKCLFYFKYHIYFIWDSSTILRIPDEPPCYVRQYGGNSCFCLGVYYNMLCILLASVFICLHMFPLVSSRVFILIMCCVYFLFLFVILLYYICSTIYSILPYTTTACLQIP